MSMVPSTHNADVIAQTNALYQPWYDARMTDKEIAEKTGRTVGGVYYWRSTRGLPSNIPEKKPHDVPMLPFLDPPAAPSPVTSSQASFSSLLPSFPLDDSPKRTKSTGKKKRSHGNTKRYMPLYLDNQMDSEIAAHFDVKSHTISSWRSRLGLPMVARQQAFNAELRKTHNVAQVSKKVVTPEQAAQTRLIAHLQSELPVVKITYQTERTMNKPKIHSFSFSSFRASAAARLLSAAERVAEKIVG